MLTLTHVLNIERSGLLTICIYSHACSIGNHTAKTSVTPYMPESCRTFISVRPISDTNPAYLMRRHQTLVNQQ